MTLIYPGLSAQCKQILRLFMYIIPLFLYSASYAQFFDIGANLPGVDSSSVAWGDYDNDGDLDILLTGDDGSKPISKIYENTNGTFEDSGIDGLTGVKNGAVAWGDYDNDGDLDILLTGDDGSKPISKIYKNTNGTFEDSGIDSLTGVKNGAVAWGDYDNDGDLDILLTGDDGSKPISKIYKNTNGTFVSLDANLTGVKNGAVAWGDYDNDGDLDILSTGAGKGIQLVSKIYRNTNGSFEDGGINSLTGVKNGAVAWGDYDNDGDLDILLTGDDGSKPVSKIYKNEVTVFKDIDININAVKCSSVAWGDYDNDGNLDILLTGNTGSKVISNIYKGFSSLPNMSPAIPTNLQATVVEDNVTLSWYHAGNDSATTYNIFITNTIQKDTLLSVMAFVNPAKPNFGHRKVVRMGNTQHNTRWTVKNLTNGTYTWSVQAISPSFSSSVFANFRSFQIHETPNTSPGSLTAELFDKEYILLKWTETVSNEAGFIIERSQSETTGFEIIDSVAANDTCYVDNVTKINSGFTYYYRVTAFNSGGKSNTITSAPITADFTSKFERSLKHLPNTLGDNYDSIAWGDYDNDGNLDILLTGWNWEKFEAVSEIYHNEGDGNFSKKESTLAEVFSGAVTWGDYDNDGYLDILLTGLDSNYTSVSKVYHNDGDGNFSENKKSTLTGVSDGAVAWGDYDNDGYLDILLTGWSWEKYKTISEIYHNEGNGTFKKTTIQLTGVEYSSVAWGDYDNDGNLDILLTGWNWEKFKTISEVYHNEGDGTFKKTTVQLTGVEYSSVAWGDYDNDGYLDILLAGSNWEKFEAVSEIYHNEGDGTFKKITPQLTGVEHSSVAWGDYDNDKDLDILLAGNSNKSGFIGKVYKNEQNTFTDTGINLTQLYNGVTSGLITWGHINNDNALDILLVARNNSRIYQNRSIPTNSLPKTPTKLAQTITKKTVELTWNTPDTAEQVTYNLRVGTKPGKGDIINVMANASTGQRKIVAIGNQQNRKTWKQELDIGFYYWSVQAIDNSFAGSKFTPEKTIEVLNPPPAPTLITAKALSRSQIKLSWRSNTKLLNRGYFWIKRSENLHGNFSIIAENIDRNAVSYTDKNLELGKTYYYQMYAKNTNHTSAYSNTVNATLNTLPEAPDSLYFSNISASELTLCWRSNSGGNELGFVVERIENPDNENSEFTTIGQVGKGITLYNNQALTSEQNYAYRVYAYNKTGSSAYSEIKHVVANTSKNLVAPDNLTTTLASNLVVKLNWKHSLPQHVQIFEIERAIRHKVYFEKIGETTNLSFQDVGLSKNTKYYYRIKAKRYNSSAYSNIDSITVSQCLPEISISKSQSSPTLTCQGQVVVLTATTNATNGKFQWFIDGSAIPKATQQAYGASKPGNYTCKVMVKDCSNISNKISIIISSTFSLAITHKNGTLEVAEVGGVSYQWYKNYQKIEEATQNSYSYDSNGLYHVVATSGGCSITSNLFAIPDRILAVRNDISHTMHIYPNPVNEVLQISLDNGISGTYKVFITNWAGQKQLLTQGTKHRTKLSQTLDISHLPAGLYVVGVELGKYKGRKKLAKY